MLRGREFGERGAQSQKRNHLVSKPGRHLDSSFETYFHICGPRVVWGDAAPSCLLAPNGVEINGDGWPGGT